jgi:hypothetical protein
MPMHSRNIYGRRECMSGTVSVDLEVCLRLGIVRRFILMTSAHRRAQVPDLRCDPGNGSFNSAKRSRKSEMLRSPKF